MQFMYTHIATNIMTTNLLGLSCLGLFYKTQDHLGLSIIICLYQVKQESGKCYLSSPTKLLFHFICILTPLQLHLQL
jgi:hypothetical protein